MHRCASCARNTSFVNPFPAGNAVCPSCLKARCVTATDAVKRYGLDKTGLAVLPRWTTSSNYHDEVNRFDKATIEAMAMVRHGTADLNVIEARARANKLAVAAVGLPPAFVAWWTAHSHRARGMKSGHSRFVQFEMFAARTRTTAEIEEDRVDFVLHNNETSMQRMFERTCTKDERIDAARKQRRADLVAALATRGFELPADCVIMGKYSIYRVVSAIAKAAAVAAGSAV